MPSMVLHVVESAFERGVRPPLTHPNSLNRTNESQARVSSMCALIFTTFELAYASGSDMEFGYSFIVGSAPLPGPR